MASIWGPLGWMTLHSVSSIYPEHPSVEERAIMRKFLEMFGETITCHYCRGHFTRMYKYYITVNPNFLNSRKDLFIFAARAHNTVNKRLDKPTPPNVKMCILTLRENTKLRNAAEFRKAYIDYLIKIWSSEFGGEAAINKRKAQQMQKINEDYFNPRDEGFDKLEIEEEDILTPLSEELTRVKNVPWRGNSGQQIKVGFQGGRLKFG